METISLEKFERILRARGVTRTSAAGSFVDHGETVDVDVSHPKFPKPRHEHAPVEPPVPVNFPQSPPARWRELHRRAKLPVVNAVAELAWLRRLADGMEAGCSCRSHWLGHLNAHPPDFADYWRWSVDAHNAVNARLGKPILSNEQAETALPLWVHNSATGLGDAVVGLYAVCGLADATGRTIVYRSHSAEWLKPASHSGVIVEPREWGVYGPDMNGGWAGYVRSIATKPSRAQGYCDNLAESLGIPAFKPVKPHVRPPLPL